MTRSRFEIYLGLLLEVFQNGDSETISRYAKIAPSASRDHLAFLASQCLVATQILGRRNIRYELSAKGYEALTAFLRLTNRKDPILRQENTKTQLTRKNQITIK